MVAAFCTPLHDAEDSQLTNRFLLSTKGFVSAKALQKVGTVLKDGAMQNTVMLCRDPCRIQSMVEMMREDVREEKRRWIRERAPPSPSAVPQMREFHMRHASPCCGAGPVASGRDHRLLGMQSQQELPGHRPTSAWQKSRPDMARTWPERGKNMAKPANTWQDRAKNMAKDVARTGKTAAKGHGKLACVMCLRSWASAAA